MDKELRDTDPEAFIAPRKKLNDLTLECLANDDDINITSSSNGSESTAAGMPRSSSVSGFGTILQQIRRAENLASRSRPAEALELLRPVLAKRSQDPDALFLQASCLAAIGNKAQALAAFAGAMAADPSHLRALLGCAALHKDSGLLHEAKEFLEKAHAIASKHRTRRQQQIEEDTNSDSDKADDSGNDSSSQQEEQEQEQQSSVLLHAESTQLYEQITQALAIVLTDLGTQVKGATGPGWKEYYKQALAVAPSYPAAHYNLGVAAAECGDSEEAVQCYQKAVELEPRYAEAWCNLGVIYKSQGRLDQAIAAYEAALISAPTLEMIRLNLASALTEKGTNLKNSGDLAGGIKIYERALALCPKHGEALYNLGVAYSEAKELDKAIFMYQMAIAAAPQCAEAHNNLGVLHRERGNLEAALTCYEAALTVRPNFPQGLNNLAVLYTQQGRAAEALNMLLAAIMAKPDYAEAYNNLGVLQRDVGDAVAAVDSYLRCCEYDPDNRNSGQNRLLALNYIHHGEEELVCAAHAAWGQRFQQLHPQLTPLQPSPEDILEAKTISTSTTCTSSSTAANKRPLVVGYISPDLFLHSVSYFAEAPLRHHNSSRVHTIVYSVCPKPDDKTRRLAAAVTAAGGTWRDVPQLSEKELADAIRADKVDILVELTGHTANNRLGTMARRPAPIQVTWIGYPNSTGLRSIDYRFTDAICDRVDTTQTYTEQLVRLPGCFLCYTPAHDAPPVALLPAVRNEYITFGSFNALAKQTPEVLAVWARILRSIPASRLVLKNKPFACDAVRQKFWAAFESEGISRDRVDLLPLTADTKDHLAQYGLMDICLDPWPYAGTTTTAEALFMGVPCLTLAGRCHAHNVGASLVSALGLERDWVASSIDDYVAKAQELSSDIEVLISLRAGLRKRMQRSVLCDAVRFVDQLEDAYRDLWNKWINGDHSGSGGGLGGGSSTEE